MLPFPGKSLNPSWPLHAQSHCDSCGGLRRGGNARGPDLSPARQPTHPKALMPLTFPWVPASPPRRKLGPSSTAEQEFKRIMGALGAQVRDQAARGTQDRFMAGSASWILPCPPGPTGDLGFSYICLA